MVVVPSGFSWTSTPAEGVSVSVGAVRSTFTVVARSRQFWATSQRVVAWAGWVLRPFQNVWLAPSFTATVGGTGTSGSMSDTTPLGSPGLTSASTTQSRFTFWPYQVRPPTTT